MTGKKKTEGELIRKSAALSQEAHESRPMDTGKKQTERVLLDSADQLKGVLSSLHETVVVVLDREGNHAAVWAPPELDERYGIRSAEIVGKSLMDILPPAEAKERISELHDMFKTGKSVRTEYPIDLPGGQFWHDVSFSPVRDQSGKVYAVVGLIRDITVQKHAQAAHRVIVENSLQGLAILEGHKVIFANPALGQTLGYTIEEMLSFLPDQWKNVVHSEDRALVLGRFRDRLEGKSVPSRYEFRMIRKDGSVRWVEMFSSRIEYNGKTAIQAAFVDITERKQAEQALKQSEADYRGLFESAHDAIIVFDPDSEIVLDVNHRACDVYGFERKEFVGMSLKAISKDIDRGKTHIKITLDKGHYHHFHTVQYRKDGSEMHLEINASAVDYKGKRAILSINRDVTERRRTEEKLREVEQERTTILNSITEHVVYHDQEMKVLWANKAAAESVNTSPERLVGRHCYEIWQERVEPCVNCPVAEAIRTGEPHRAEMTSGDGRVWFISGHPVRSTDDKVIGAVEITLEITERKKAEDALRESEEKFRMLAEQSPNMIFINKNGKVVYANKKCEETMGYPTEEFYSSDFDFAALVSPEFRDLIKANFEKHMRGEEVDPVEYALVTKNGERIQAILTTKLINYQGEPSILGTVTDITEQKRMEEELLKARKLESIGILAGGIAHDFNNILTGILGNISLAKAKARPEDEIFSILVKAEKASLRAKGLTQQLLTFSKGGAPVKETTSIAELIRDSADFVLRGSNVRCEFSIPDDLWPVEIDKGQINQVLNNLIINADQAMPEGGSIKLSVENVILRAKEILPLRPGDYVRIILEDQGIGIPKQHLQKIFDPYFSTKRKGNGLGLTTSYSILKNHNGHIQVKSELGAGASFVVYLPASPKKIPKTRHPEAKVFSGKGRILVMDDEEVVRDVIGDLLAILGYQVEFARDGAELIELYKKTQASPEPFDAVIMDLTVPGGMGGQETLQKLLEMDPEVRAIVSSGYCNDPVMSDFKKYGFQGVVAKPFKIEDLGEVLHRVLASTSKAPA